MVYVASTFYVFQKTVIQYNKTMDSNMRKMSYFGDGAASQYKDRKNVTNLVNKNNFGISAEWYFFNTSHGKSPCDAVGGTTKWQTARTSL
jgi:hypothetical protein